MCCEPTIVPFNLVATTSITYTPAMQELYGQEPHVEVYYLVDGKYEQSDLSQVKIVGSSIEVDHGGVNTGIVKIF